MSILQDKIEEEKQRNKIINDFAIDIQFLNEVTPQLLNPNIKTNTDHESLVSDYEVLCNRISEDVLQIKNLVKSL
jgi:hypothetical protein